MHAIEYVGAYVCVLLCLCVCTHTRAHVGEGVSACV